MDSFAEMLRGTGDAVALVAGFLLIVAMALSSLRWLRIVALASGVAALVYFGIVRPNTAMLGLSALFILANGGQLAGMIVRARNWTLSDEERELLEHVLEVQDPEQQRHLLDVVEWIDVGEGEVLMRQGDTAPPLIYVASGAGSIEVDGTMVGVCGPEDFLGEMSLAMGEPASATVTITNEARIARFDRDGLSQLTSNIPDLGKAFDHAINRGLAAKIVRMNKAMTDQAGDAAG